MPNIQPANRYYPRLSSIVNTDDIPEILGFIKNGIVTVFDKMHFKDLQFTKSPMGDAAIYRKNLAGFENLQGLVS